MKDAYKILGVPRSASSEEIKASFRKLARERHPDADPDNPWAEDEFKDLTAAYRVLSSDVDRARYDRGEIDAMGTELRRARPKRGPGSGPFERFRQRKSKTGGKGPTGIKMDGTNVSYALKVSFEEAASGAVKHVSMTNGKRLKVTIPEGTTDGQVLRLKGQGMPGLGGGKDGDALVEIVVEPHKAFRIEGANVHLDLPVTLKEAVLGAKIEVPTLEGKVAMNVPEGSNAGTVLRLKGKGLRTGADRAAKGDQFVTLQVVLPGKPDAELRAFLETWDNDQTGVRRHLEDVLPETAE